MPTHRGITISRFTVVMTALVFVVFIMTLGNHTATAHTKPPANRPQGAVAAINNNTVLVTSLLPSNLYLPLIAANTDANGQATATPLPTALVTPTTWLTNTPTRTPTPTATSLPTNIALNQPAIASAESSTNMGPDKAVDGNPNTSWGAGRFAPAWIQIDLQTAQSISKLQLRVDQTPNGFAHHNIYVAGADGNFTLLTEFQGDMTGGQMLTYELSATQRANHAMLNAIRYVKVETVESVSWVAWREIEIYGVLATAPTATATPILQPTATHTPTATPIEDCTIAAGDTRNTWGQVHDANLAGFAPFRYGQHYPYGYAAVGWIYSEDGLWRQITDARPLNYRYNYYRDGMDNNPDNDISHPPDPAHPLPVPGDTVASQVKFRHEIATGCAYHTTRDANGYVLFDADNDNAMDSQPTGAFAFHEHSARGADNQICTGTVPFTLFWFDDNWLTRYMSQAYGRPLSDGLSDLNRTFIRWNILDGGTGHWSVYNGTALDQLALDGLYELAQGRVQGAWQKWSTIQARLQNGEDSTRQRYAYHIDEIYHLSLFLVLTSHLMDADVTSAQRHELIQHWVSLRSNLLSLQERQNGERFSWVTHADRGCGRYMSTEGTATAVLALGAGAVHVLEAGSSPLQMAENNYYLRVDEDHDSTVDQYVLSAVTGVANPSQPGFMVYGPYWQYPQGTYTVDFFLRAPAPLGTMATVEVYDADSNHFLAQQDVQATAMASGNEWSRIRVPITVTNVDNQLEFRVYWHGTANMDVAAIRIR